MAQWHSYIANSTGWLRSLYEGRKASGDKAQMDGRGSGRRTKTEGPDKRVESAVFPRLDEGSTPSSSTDDKNERVSTKPLNRGGFVLICYP